MFLVCCNIFVTCNVCGQTLAILDQIKYDYQRKANTRNTRLQGARERAREKLSRAVQSSCLGDWPSQ